MRKRCKQENQHFTTLSPNAIPILSGEISNAGQKRGPPAFPADLSRRPKKKTATDNYNAKVSNKYDAETPNPHNSDTTALRRERSWRETGEVPNSDSEDGGQI
jgi:hypothetical protein